MLMPMLMIFQTQNLFFGQFNWQGNINETLWVEFHLQSILYVKSG
jgi:hypothetical protein